MAVNVSNENRKTYTVRLPAELAIAIDTLAVITNRSVNDLFVQAVDSLVDSYNQEASVAGTVSSVASLRSTYSNSPHIKQEQARITRWSSKGD